MNNWGTDREVEKSKTASERRLALKADAAKVSAQLRRRADAVVAATFGHHSPIDTELRNAAELIDRLARELRVPQVAA